MQSCFRAAWATPLSDSHLEVLGECGRDGGGRKRRISHLLHWAGEGGGELEVELSSESCGWEGDGAPNFRIKLGHLKL